MLNKNLFWFFRILKYVRQSLTRWCFSWQIRHGYCNKKLHVLTNRNYYFLSINKIKVSGTSSFTASSIFLILNWNCLFFFSVFMTSHKLFVLDCGSSPYYPFCQITICNCSKVKIQWKPLNVITFGQTVPDHINRMITLTKRNSLFNWLEKGKRDLRVLEKLITLTKWLH